MKRIVIFASGSGTNARAIIRKFSINTYVKVVSVYTNKVGAGVIAHARDENVPCVVFSREDLYESNKIRNELRENNIDLIVLAGFLWLFPAEIVAEFPVLNIHPALLPKYGGKGMYGLRVYQAVLENKEKESGITIHLVNEVYDSGLILRQVLVPVSNDDTPDSLQKRIQEKEYEHYPQVIAEVLLIENLEIKD
ncbi:MAG: phosphoribosylglycinamide formyltransferase [Mangrovibacterium sp.]